MSQISRRNIENSAIDSTKLEKNDNYTVVGLTAGYSGHPGQLAVKDYLGATKFSVDSTGNIIANDVRAKSITSEGDETNYGNIIIAQGNPDSTWILEAGVTTAGDFQIRQAGNPIGALYFDGDASQVTILSDATVTGNLDVSLGTGVFQDATVTGILNSTNAVFQDATVTDKLLAITVGIGNDSSTPSELLELASQSSLGIGADINNLYGGGPSHFTIKALTGNLTVRDKIQNVNSLILNGSRATVGSFNATDATIGAFSNIKVSNTNQVVVDADNSSSTYPTMTVNNAALDGTGIAINYGTQKGVGISVSNFTGTDSTAIYANGRGVGLRVQGGWRIQPPQRNDGIAILADNSSASNPTIEAVNLGEAPTISATNNVPTGTVFDGQATGGKVLNAVNSSTSNPTIVANNNGTGGITIHAKYLGSDGTALLASGNEICAVSASNNSSTKPTITVTNSATGGVAGYFKGDGYSGYFDGTTYSKCLAVGMSPSGYRFDVEGNARITGDTSQDSLAVTASGDLHKAISGEISAGANAIAVWGQNNQASGIGVQGIAGYGDGTGISGKARVGVYAEGLYGGGGLAAYLNGDATVVQRLWVGQDATVIGNIKIGNTWGTLDPNNLVYFQESANWSYSTFLPPQASNYNVRYSVLGNTVNLTGILAFKTALGPPLIYSTWVKLAGIPPYLLNGISDDTVAFRFPRILDTYDSSNYRLEFVNHSPDSYLRIYTASAVPYYLPLSTDHTFNFSVAYELNH